MKCQEDYSSLKESLANVTASVNSLLEKGTIAVDGREVLLDIYLGGDYKVCLMELIFCTTTVLEITALQLSITVIGAP